jgi:hypothetical protein
MTASSGQAARIVHGALRDRFHGVPQKRRALAICSD